MPAFSSSPVVLSCAVQVAWYLQGLQHMGYELSKRDVHRLATSLSHYPLELLSGRVSAAQEGAGLHF